MNPAEAVKGYTDPMSAEDFTLPVIQTDLGEQEDSSCSPKIYVSNEEAALLQAMRSLREKSQTLKAELLKTGNDGDCGLAARLEEAREEWKKLAAQREKAYIHKMVALGHLPPEADEAD